MTLATALFHVGGPVILVCRSATCTRRRKETIITAASYTCVFLLWSPTKMSSVTNVCRNVSNSVTHTHTQSVKLYAGVPIRHFHTETLFCDCQLKWLLLWARSNSVRISNSTVCMFPTHLHGLEFHNLREQQLACGKDFPQSVFPI